MLTNSLFKSIAILAMVHLPFIAFNQNPGGVPGSTTWFLPEAANMTLAGTDVSQWNSIVGGINVNQGTVSSQPEFIFNDASDNYNGSVLFNGTSDELTQASASGVLGNTGTAIVVFRHLNVSTAFGSNANGSHYQLKHYNAAFSSSSGTIKWQRSQNATNPALLSSSSTKTRINFLLGGTIGASYLQRNGSIQSATTSTVNGAIVQSDLSFGSGGTGGELSNIHMQEVITFNFNLSAVQMDLVESYLAIKYGVTLGVNGGAIENYYNTSGNIIYNATTNSGFAFDIAGIGNDNATGLAQLKSHFINGPSNGTFSDILTVANGVTFTSPSAFSADQSYFVWGHDGGILNNTNAIVNYVSDNGEVIQGIFDREWKSQESGTVNDVVLEFDLSSVAGPAGAIGTNDLANVRLLVDEDGNYSVGATSYAPTSYDNTTGIVYFRHDFLPTSGVDLDQNNGFHFTLGTTDMSTTPLPVELKEFEVINQECINSIEWSTLSESNCDRFTVDQSNDLINWIEIAEVKGSGNSQSEINYSIRDAFKFNEFSYYRLIQHDFDGQSNVLGMSGIESFCLDNVDPVLFPNPVNNVLMIGVPESGVFVIRDLFGRVLKKGTLIVGESTIDVNELKSGSYLISIQLSNDKTYVKQFSKL